MTTGTESGEVHMLPCRNIAHLAVGLTPGAAEPPSRIVHDSRSDHLERGKCHDAQRCKDKAGGSAGYAHGPYIQRHTRYIRRAHNPARRYVCALCENEEFIGTCRVRI